MEDLLSRRYARVPSVLVLFGLCLLMLRNPRQATAQTQVPTSFAAEMVALINREREGAGVATLSMEAAIGTAAELRARDMAARRYFSHVDPDGRNFGAVLTQCGVEFGIAGENIARSSVRGEEVLMAVHVALLASAPHRENMLEPSFRRAGVGAAEAEGVWYVAVIFAD